MLYSTNYLVFQLFLGNVSHKCKRWILWACSRNYKSREYKLDGNSSENPKLQLYLNTGSLEGGPLRFSQWGYPTVEQEIFITIFLSAKQES